MKKQFLTTLSFLLIFTILLMCCCNSGFALPEDKIYIRYGSVGQPTSNYTYGIEYFIEKVAEYSNGRIIVEHFGQSVLGGERDMAEGVALGTIEMCITASGPLTNFAPGFKIFDLPYLVTNKEVAFEVMDGEIGREILDELKPIGIYALSFWENGFRQLYNSKKEIKHPQDLKGLKIRTMENEIHIQLFNILGAYATPIGGAELFTSLQQGVVDGHENPLNNLVSSGMYEAQKYVSLTSHVYSPAVTMINLNLFNSLSEDDKNAITRADAEARDYERRISEEGDKTLAQEVEKLGLKVTEVNIHEWQEAAEPVYNRFKNELNMNYVNALKGTDK